MSKKVNCKVSFKEAFIAGYRNSLYGYLILQSDLMPIEDTGVYLDTKHKDDFIHANYGVLAAITQVNFGFKSVPVILKDRFFDHLPENVQKFLLYHEVGHSVHNHLQGLTLKKSKKIAFQRTLGTLPEMEVEADNYSAKFIGKENAIEAITFMIKETNLPIASKIELIRRRNALCKSNI